MTQRPRESSPSEPTPAGLPWYARIVRWVAGHEPAVLISVLLIAVAGWVFIELADEVTEGETVRFDQRLLLGLRDPDRPDQPIGPAWLNGVMLDVTAMGGWTVLVLVTFGVSGFLWMSGRRAVTAWVLLSSIGGLILGMLLKEWYSRPRPQVVPQLVDVHTASFPSGHSMMSAAVYLTLAMLVATVVPRWALRLYIVTLAVLVTLAVGFSRVYLGVHYPTDVLAGWSLGLAWALLCRLLMSRWLTTHPHTAAAEGATPEPAAPATK
jgi:undecaprenyl-diphosphatase